MFNTSGLENSAANTVQSVAFEEDNNRYLQRKLRVRLADTNQNCKQSSSAQIRSAETEWEDLDSSDGHRLRAWTACQLSFEMELHRSQRAHISGSLYVNVFSVQEHGCSEQSLKHFEMRLQLVRQTGQRPQAEFK